MKHLLFIFSCMLYCVGIHAQQGYYYGNEFVELKPTASSAYIPLWQDSSVTVNKIAGKKSYRSLYYHTSVSDSVCISPRIIIRLEESVGIDDIIKGYENELTATQVDTQIYYIDCHVATSEDVLQFVSIISNQKGVVWCEPDMYALKPAATSNSNPLYSRQYYLKNTGQFGGTVGMDINIESAWNVVGGGGSVPIAVLDSGVDLDHEDLKDNLLQGYTVGNETGYGAPQNWTLNNKSHGTACAGIIGAADNSIGIKGIAYTCPILPVNIEPNLSSSFNEYGFATTSQVAEAINWSCDQGAKVLSCSWGGHVPSNYVKEAIEKAISKKIAVVAAAGNDTSTVCFPATIDNVITVGAIDRTGQIHLFSNTGKELDVVAFGSYITTTDVSGTLGYTSSDYYYYFNGTSAACPQVAGIVALMMSVNPSLTVPEIIDILHATSRDLGDAGRDDTYGYGLVNAYAAVVMAKERKMTINGPSVINNSATYSVSNLPYGCTVSWKLSKHASSINPSYLSISSDTPQAYSATVYNTKVGASANILTATVHCPDESVGDYNITRTIAGDGSFSALYREIFLDGTTTFNDPVLPRNDEDVNYASAASDVIIQSDNFWNRQVSYVLSDAPYNSKTLHIEDNRIIFEMPNLQSGQTMIFTVSGGGISNTYQFEFGKRESSLYSQAVTFNSLSNGKIMVQVGKDEIDNLVRSNHLVPYTIDIYSVPTFVKVKSISFSQQKFTVDLSSLKQGIYLLSVTANGQIYTQKISIKQ